MPLLSVSDIKQYMSCPRQWYNRAIKRRGMAEKSTALDFGTFYHWVMQAKLTGQDWREYTSAMMALTVEPLDPKALSMVELYTPCFDAWQKPEGWEVIQVEQEQRMYLGDIDDGREDNDIVLVGKPDAIVRWNGRYWLVQHKTLAPSTPSDIYAELIRTDWHEIAYQCMMEENGYPNIAGTLLVVFRKISAKALSSGDTGTPFETFYLARPREVVDSALLDIGEVAYRMFTRAPIQNRSSCAGPFRNHLCQYKDVCDGRTTLANDRYTDIEPRYTSDISAPTE